MAQSAEDFEKWFSRFWLKLLKNRYGFSLHIVVILLALVFDWREIIQYTYGSIGQTHIIPQLLTLFNSYRRNRLTFQYDISFAQEIHIVFVRQRMSMI